MQISNFILPFQPVLPEELLPEILLVPNDKSYGLYSSPTKLFKCSSAVIAPELIHQNSKLLKLRQYLREMMILTQTTIDLSLYFQILIEYLTKLFKTDRRAI